MPPSGLDVGGAGRVVALSIHIPMVPGWMHALLEDEAVYGQCEERTVTVREERKPPPPRNPGSHGLFPSARMEVWGCALPGGVLAQFQPQHCIAWTWW